MKDYNVTIEDNGAAFEIVINAGCEQRFVIAAFNTLSGAWAHIAWMYAIEQQIFTVGKKRVIVTEWLAGMRKAGYIE